MHWSKAGTLSELTSLISSGFCLDRRLSGWRHFHRLLPADHGHACSWLNGSYDLVSRQRLAAVCMSRNKDDPTGALRGIADACLQSESDLCSAKECGARNIGIPRTAPADRTVDCLGMISSEITKPVKISAMVFSEICQRIRFIRLILRKSSIPVPFTISTLQFGSSLQLFHFDSSVRFFSSILQSGPSDTLRDCANPDALSGSAPQLQD